METCLHHNGPAKVLLVFGQTGPYSYNSSEQQKGGEGSPVNGRENHRNIYSTSELRLKVHIDRLHERRKLNTRGVCSPD